MSHNLFISLCASVVILSGCQTLATPAPHNTIERPQTSVALPPAIPERPTIPEEISQPSDQPITDPNLPSTIRTRPFDQSLIQIAVILPLDHNNPQIRAEAQGIYNGIEMALFDGADENTILHSLPTDGSISRTIDQFNAAQSKQVDIILGPLMSQNTRQASGTATARGIPVLAFTNDTQAVSSGAHLVSLATEEEVRNLVAFAVSNNVTGFGFFGPNTAYGRRVEAALRQQVTLSGRSLIASEFYDANVEIPTGAAERFVTMTQDYATASPRQFAVLIPDSSVKLRSVATLLPYFGLNERNTVFMGTRVWNDPSVWREPVLAGGIFPLADPVNAESWSAEFSRLFGRNPTRLSSYGYDATQLTMTLFADGRLNPSPLYDQSVFIGVNGAYRFRPNQTAERNLAIMRISADGKTQIVSEAALDFDGQF